ncbi:hypothetical protein ACO0LD_31270 [Undibacterium sp. Ji83W]|uniref:hypothetical protein n=1 Tax=Undibacterium sp. Ji83W TaxID=3413043 RepID=UPI003BEF8713
MRRMLINAMTNKNGLIYHDEELFSGVSYEKLDDETICAWIVQDGKIEMPYLSRYFDDRSDLLHVDLTASMSDYEIPCYEEKPFSGVAYSFDGNYCEREALLIDGEVISDTWWSNDGVLLRYEQHAAGYCEIYEWYGEGVINCCTITTSNSFNGYLKFLLDGRLSGVGSRRGFFDAFSNIASKSPIFPVRDLSKFFTLKCAEEIWLVGEDIDDLFVEKMCDSGMLMQTEKIYIVDASITDVGIHLLAKCPALKSFDIREKIEDRQQLLKTALAGIESIQADFN